MRTFHSDAYMQYRCHLKIRREERHRIMARSQFLEHDRTFVINRDGNKVRVRMNWENRLDSLDEKEFRHRYALSKDNFADLAERLRHVIERPRINGLRAELKLSMTLRILRGASYLDCADMHGVHRATLYAAFKETLEALDAELELPFKNKESLKDTDLLNNLVGQFATRTGGVIDGCVGVVWHTYLFHWEHGVDTPPQQIDGIHVRIERPSENGDQYFCRKGCFSINAQAIVSAERKFLWVNCSSTGPSHDSTAYLSTSLSRAVDEGALPPAYFFVGDEAYKACCEQIVTPFPGTILNGSSKVLVATGWNPYRRSRSRPPARQR
jgi:hypothetical protein